MKKKVTAIIVAGGVGKRMGVPMPKPFVKIRDKQLLFYCLDAFQSSKYVDEIVLVIVRKFLKRTTSLINTKKYKKLAAVVTGGATRAQSVYLGLCVSDSAYAVLIHDAARPFIKEKLIKACALTALKGISCLAAVPATAAIKNVNLKNKFVTETPVRKNLWYAQTPQAFKKATLMSAYKKLGKRAFMFTDDASLIEAVGGKVKVIQGDYSNIKITTKDDLKMAEALIKD